MRKELNNLSSIVIDENHQIGNIYLFYNSMDSTALKYIIFETKHKGKRSVFDVLIYEGLIEFEIKYYEGVAVDVLKNYEAIKKEVLTWRENMA